MAYVITDACTACGACVETCPVEAMVRDDRGVVRRRLFRCIGCGSCARACPFGAIPNQLGGTPVLEPKKWYDVSKCGYDPPADPHVKTILEQNIKGEQCAIGVYKDLVKLTAINDPVTYNIVLQILQDEVEHEHDLQDLQDHKGHLDLQPAKQNFRPLQVCLHLEG